MGERLWILPTKPGTVIAIGGWWFVKLESYEHEESGPVHKPGEEPWELLPARSDAIRQSMEAARFSQQTVYSHEQVLIEAAQEGGYFVIAEPVERPYGPTLVTRPEPLAERIGEAG